MIQDYFPPTTAEANREAQDAYNFQEFSKECYPDGRRLYRIKDAPYRPIANTRLFFAQNFKGDPPPPLRESSESDLRTWRSKQRGEALREALDKEKVARSNWRGLKRRLQWMLYEAARSSQNQRVGDGVVENPASATVTPATTTSLVRSSYPLAPAVGINQSIKCMAELKKRDPNNSLLTGIPDQLGDSILELREEPATLMFEEMIGVHNPKQIAQDALDAMKHPEEGNVPSGMLLTGEAGTGKSMLAKAIATDVGDCPVFKVKQDWFTGNEKKKVTAIFAVARVMAPSIIFFNECDSIMNKGGANGPAKYVGHFKDAWDTIEDSPVLVMGATNNPKLIDGALYSRFTSKIQFHLPNAESRKLMLQNAFKKKTLMCAINEREWDAIAAATEGKSGRDLILGLVAGIACRHARKHRHEAEKPPITANDFVGHFSNDEQRIFKDAIQAPGPSGKRPVSEHRGDNTVSDESGNSEAAAAATATGSSSKRPASTGTEAVTVDGRSKRSKSLTEAAAPSPAATPSPATAALAVAPPQVRALVAAIDKVYEVDPSAPRVLRTAFFKSIHNELQSPGIATIATFAPDDLLKAQTRHKKIMSIWLVDALEVISAPTSNATARLKEDQEKGFVWVPAQEVITACTSTATARVVEDSKNGSVWVHGLRRRGTVDHTVQ